MADYARLARAGRLAQYVAEVAAAAVVVMAVIAGIGFVIGNHTLAFTALAGMAATGVLHVIARLTQRWLDRQWLALGRREDQP